MGRLRQHFPRLSAYPETHSAVEECPRRTVRADPTFRLASSVRACTVPCLWYRQEHHEELLRAATTDHTPRRQDGLRGRRDRCWPNPAPVRAIPREERRCRAGSCCP